MTCLAFRTNLIGASYHGVTGVTCRLMLSRPFSHSTNSSAIPRISYTLGRCTRDTAQALEAAGNLRSKQQQLNRLFTESKVDINGARQLTWEIQRLTGQFFSTVASIEQSLEDVSVQAQSLQPPAEKHRSWWGKIVRWIKNIWFVATSGSLLQDYRVDEIFLTVRDFLVENLPTT
jgi:hypothetical protein